MKSEFYKIIEYCEAIKADERAKRVAVDMWKKTCERYITSVMSTMDKCRWHGIYGLISNYEQVNLPREAFFIYMKDVIENYI